jgi:hypothetical protein
VPPRGLRGPTRDQTHYLHLQAPPARLAHLHELHGGTQRRYLIDDRPPVVGMPHDHLRMRALRMQARHMLQKLRHRKYLADYGARRQKSPQLRKAISVGLMITL